MKSINVIILLLAMLCGFNLSFADSLHGIAKKYDIEDDTLPVSVDTNDKLPTIFYSGKYKIVFEETTIANIKNYLGGKIKKDHSDTWVCYNSQKEGITYWFISYTVMQHGDLSTIIIAPLDRKSKCDTPLHAIDLKPNPDIPALKSTRRQVFNHFDLMINKRPSIFTITSNTKVHDQHFKEDCDQLNSVQYLFKKGKAIGIFISQVTTN